MNHTVALSVYYEEEITIYNVFPGY